MDRWYRKIIKGIDKLINYNPNLSSAIIEGFVRACVDDEYNKTGNEHELAVKKTAKKLTDWLLVDQT